MYVRPATARLSITAVLLAFLQAPFLHVHGLEETRDHPASSILHVHYHGQLPDEGQAIGAHTPDEDALETDWSIAPPPDLGPAFTLSVAEISLAEPLRLVSVSIPAERPRGHDPPDLVPAPPRAPPA